MTWPNYLHTRLCQYTRISLDRPYLKVIGATSTLGCHWNHTGWCQHPVVFQWRSSVNLHNWNTGRPLEPQVHWDVIGTTLADVSTQWCPSGDPVLICITATLERHWKATERPLKAHWKHAGYQQFFRQWHSNVHWGHWIATGLPLNYHWLRVRKH